MKLWPYSTWVRMKRCDRGDVLHYLKSNKSSTTQLIEVLCDILLNMSYDSIEIINGYIGSDLEIGARVKKFLIGIQLRECQVDMNCHLRLNGPGWCVARLTAQWGSTHRNKMDIFHRVSKLTIIDAKLSGEDILEFVCQFWYCKPTIIQRNSDTLSELLIAYDMIDWVGKAPRRRRIND